MRARIARNLLRRLERHTPALLVSVQSQILLNLAARAFHTPGKSVWLREPGQALREYAEFTVGCMRRGGAKPEHLFREAFALGRRLRRLTGFTDAEDIERLIFYLYRNLQISMSGHLPGEITVRKCYFSGFYTPEQCALMSYADSGVISGLFGGGTLTFTERITGGIKSARPVLQEESRMSGRAKTAVVIGTGAGGGMIAKELQGKYQVTILEAGGDFKPLSLPIRQLARFRHSGLFFDERLIRLLFPNMLVEKTRDIVMVRGIGVGGTTTLATGNAVRCDGALKALGINLDAQFEELYRELPITTEHQKNWTETTKKMYAVFGKMGLCPVVTPKLLNAPQCVGCGHCAIGCPTGAKWDARALIAQAIAGGAELVTGCRVSGLEIAGKSVTGVHARRRGKTTLFHADLVVLAAGGLGTPGILQNSGIPCEKTLFVDPVLCVAGPLPGFGQDKQILMPFISQQDGYILSPYIVYS